MRMEKRRRWFAALVLLCVLVIAFACFPARFPSGTDLMLRLRGKATVSDRLAEYGPAVRARWQPYFAAKGVAYPPQKVLLVGLKREKQLQVYAAGAGQPWQLIRAFPIQRLSGKMGPKLRQDDYQVPEGFYRVASLNPNSAFHLALRVDYPNGFDRAQAQRDGRTDLGGNIMIHGSDASAGCLAMGDRTAEDLFVLAAETGPENVAVLLSPVDFRVSRVPDDAERPTWVGGLYAEIQTALQKLPLNEGRTHGTTG
jgi:hypothetical protein